MACYRLIGASNMTAPSVLVRAYIGIGANLGDAQANVLHAFAALAQLPETHLVLRSDLFRTTPIDADGDDYINAVAGIDTLLAAAPLLDALLAIELALGRLRTYRNAPRPLDLDLLLYGQQCIDTPSLTVPHPRLTQRAFALMPLLQIAPGIAIPGLGPACAFAAAVADQGIAMHSAQPVDKLVLTLH